MLVSEAIEQLSKLLAECDAPESLELFIDADSYYHVKAIVLAEQCCVDVVCGTSVEFSDNGDRTSGN